jgi:hypothetical protein
LSVAGREVTCFRLSGNYGVGPPSVRTVVPGWTGPQQPRGVSIRRLTGFPQRKSSRLGEAGAPRAKYPFDPPALRIERRQLALDFHGNRTSLGQHWNDTPNRIEEALSHRTVAHSVPKQLRGSPQSSSHRASRPSAPCVVPGDRAPSRMRIAAL